MSGQSTLFEQAASGAPRDVYGSQPRSSAAAQWMTIKEASLWASRHLSKNVTPSNISYLIQYGKISKHTIGGATKVSKADLLSYYRGFRGGREVAWKAKLGNDLNWALSFDHLKEQETTKHVHRLHPYKGKFIPQLVEYFLGDHIDDFKTAAFFRRGDVILDPFSGSGTTLVQCSEQGMHAIGIDISAFNTLIANVKIARSVASQLRREIARVTKSLRGFIEQSENARFEARLADELAIFNRKYFPAPAYRRSLHQGEINEGEYAAAKQQAFEQIFAQLLKGYQITIRQAQSETFLERWYLAPVMREIRFVYGLLQGIDDPTTKQVMTVILSRTMRSCRATTHADLATLKQPVLAPYYCSKHGKICKPIFSILSWWERYCKDTANRLSQFAQLRTDTHQVAIRADARNINIAAATASHSPALGTLVQQKGIRGIFSSPPYVGLIDYHEQHAYAYELFGLERNDELEIGPLSKGQGRQARAGYIDGIVQVLNNCKRYLSEDYHVLLVANDKYDLYPTIAQRAGMTIVNQYKRPVLNRTERDKSAYAESIFHLRAQWRKTNLRVRKNKSRREPR